MRTPEQIYKRYKQFATGVTQDEFVKAVKNIQDEAFNHALDLAANNATTRANDEKTSIIVDKKSILELKLDYSIKEPAEDIRYSEEEVRELFKAIKVTQEFAKQFNLSCDIVELFEQNKKK